MGNLPTKTKLPTTKGNKMKNAKMFVSTITGQPAILYPNGKIEFFYSFAGWQDITCFYHRTEDFIFDPRFDFIGAL